MVSSITLNRSINWFLFKKTADFHRSCLENASYLYSGISESFRFKAFETYIWNVQCNYGRLLLHFSNLSLSMRTTRSFHLLLYFLIVLLRLAICRSFLIVSFLMWSLLVQLLTLLRNFIFCASNLFFALSLWYVRFFVVR